MTHKQHMSSHTLPTLIVFTSKNCENICMRLGTSSSLWLSRKSMNQIHFQTIEKSIHTNTFIHDFFVFVAETAQLRTEWEAFSMFFFQHLQQHNCQINFRKTKVIPRVLQAEKREFINKYELKNISEAICLHTHTHTSAHKVHTLHSDSLSITTFPIHFIHA